MKNSLLKNAYGIALCTFIALLAYYIDSFIGLNKIVVAFFIALVIGNSIKIADFFNSGISFSSKNILELSIVFLAFSINLVDIKKLGYAKLGFLVAMLIIVLFVGHFLAQRFKTNTTTPWLVTFGTAICGSSAIAALAPTITKDKVDAGIAIAVVNLLGSLGMLVLPVFFKLFYDSHLDIGFALGASLQSVANVSGAAYAISDTTGEVALTVKLARVALLSPLLMFFTFIIRKNKTTTNTKSKLVFPLYLWFFIGITVINSLVYIPSIWISVFEDLGKLLLTISMAAVGLKVSFKQLYSSGTSAMIFGLLIFIVQISLSMFLITFY